MGQLNGRVCEEMSVDKQTGRHMVRLNPADPASMWKKIKPENLVPVSAPSAPTRDTALSSDRCKMCWTTAEERTRLGRVMPFLLSTGPLDASACPSCGRLSSPRGPVPAG